jgi:DNA polymerase I-like protein with 3'-5' exonuclease and polymerase domains
MAPKSQEHRDQRVTHTNRRRRAWNETPKITALYNTPVQGTAANITKKALGMLPQRLSDIGSQIIRTVHDEIILEVPQGLAGEAAVILKGP